MNVTFVRSWNVPPTFGLNYIYVPSIFCVYCLYPTHTQSIFYLHAVYILHTRSLYSAYMQSIFYPHAVHILPTCSLYSTHTVCILSILWLYFIPHCLLSVNILCRLYRISGYFAYILYVLCLYSVYTQATFHSHSVCILHTFCIIPNKSKYYQSAICTAPHTQTPAAVLRLQYDTSRGFQTAYPKAPHSHHRHLRICPIVY